jgi:hypothetical protein
VLPAWNSSFALDCSGLDLPFRFLLPSQVGRWSSVLRPDLQ